MIKTRLMKLVPQARRYIISAVIWQWIALLMQIFIIYEVVGLIEEGMYQNWNEKNIVKSILLVCLALSIRFLCDRQVTKASYQASADVKRTLRQVIYDKLLRLGMSYRNRVTTSSVVQMTVEGVEQLETYFGKYMPQLFYSLLAPLTLFVVLCFVSVKASAILLLCVPLIPLSIVLVQKYAKKLLQKYWGSYEELGDSFLENLQGLTTLKIYQADGYKAEEMDKEAQYFRKITMKVLTMQLNSTSVMDIMAYGSAAIGMIIAGSEFMAAKITFGQMLMVVLLASEFFIPLRLLGSFFHIAMNGMAASDRIFELLDLEEEDSGELSIDEEQFFITLKQVDFCYEPEKPILQKISMEFPAGKMISLVGKSGCGKSTIASIIMKKNQSYGGEILLNGIPLNEISEEALMRNITMVSHDSYIFKGTVKENLCIGKPQATKEEMIKALRMVNLWGYMETQQGLDTVVLERGENFSGGQRQRLAIARALLHDTPMYIFDEATSNIDAESEEIIMEVIRKLAKVRTVLLISHRLANVVDSDCIYMLESGHILEMGTHEKLMQNHGKYRQLFESQCQLESYGKERK